MKKLIFIIVLLSNLNYGYAQRKGFISSYSTISSAKEYFTENISVLKDIEGVYDVSMTPHFSGGNMLVGLRTWGGQEYSTTAFIWKQSDGTMCLQYLDTKGVPISQSMTLAPLGSSNAYRLSGKYSEKYSHFGNSGVLNFDISTRVIFDRIGFSMTFSGNDQYHKVDMEMSFVKTFPDAITIANKRHEADVPLEWSGSGFALREGYVVTSYHVIEEAKSICIQGVNGNFTNKYSARVIATDKINDIALLKLDGITPANIPYSVKTFTSDVGEDVWVLGYPLTSTMGDEIKLTTGVVSAKSGFEGDVSLYQISAPIQPGNSGGPVFDGKGNLIGIVCAHHKGAENVSYAIKASYLRNLIESSINHDILPKTNKLSTLNLAGKVKAVKSYVYYITCSSRTNSKMSYTDSSNSSNINSSSISHNNYFTINTSAGLLSVTSVEVKAHETILSLSSTNNLSGGWMNISKGAYIIANGTKYKLIGIEGITYEPERTPFSYQGQTKKFKLHFQPIPQGTKTIDFIESPSSNWKIYGIKIK